MTPGDGVAGQHHGRFLGIGVRTYLHGHAALPRAATEVTRTGELLGADFDIDLLIDPTEEQVRARIAAVRGDRALRGAPLVVMWGGHGHVAGGDLRLLARDSGHHRSDGLAVREITLTLAESGASQLLLVIDACFSAAAAIPSASAALSMFGRPEQRQAWMGILASCQATGAAHDGLFGRRLQRLLSHGPAGEELRRRWSLENRRISGHDLADAVLKEWDVGGQQPFFLGFGDAWRMLPNPLRRAYASSQVADHLLRAARGGAGADEPSWFAGRTREVNAVAGWVRAGRPGVHVVTGSAGTGKSAILGRVLSLADLHERERLWGSDETATRTEAAITHVPAHAYARGLTVDRLAQRLEEGLARRTGIPRRAGREASASSLVARVRTATSAIPPGHGVAVIAVDGLDEARGEASILVDNLLRPLGQYACVIVTTRNRPAEPGGPGLVDRLTPVEVVDLDEPVTREHGVADIRSYVAARLAGVSPAMDPATVAALLAATGAPTFLLARMVTDQLRANPVDTGEEGWPDRVTGSIGAAILADLASLPAPSLSAPSLPAPSYRELPAQVSPAALAQHLLSGLTWAYGTGFPHEEWLAVVDATAPAGLRIGPDDLSWLLEHLGRYVAQDGEEGVATYRLADESVAGVLSPEPGSVDSRARTVAVALLDRYRRLVSGGVPAREPSYLWEYGWRHAAQAGPVGLSLLRAVCDIDGTLQVRLAAAERESALLLRAAGQRHEALAAAQRAVALYRETSAVDPAHLPDLAAALANLGAAYRDVGRAPEAVDATSEAAARYRELSATGQPYTADLASTLNNLGVHLRDAGRVAQAYAAAEEAVGLYRELATANPSYQPDLAMALATVSPCQRDLGEYGAALGSATEAVDLYRLSVADDPSLGPSLASALNALSLSHRELGHDLQACAVAMQAVAGYRQAVAAASGSTVARWPQLASALNTMSDCHRELGDYDAALRAATESVDRYRQVVATDPALWPNLGRALTNLSAGQLSLGQFDPARRHAAEAVGIYRRAVADNPAHAAGLATALTTLGGVDQAAGDTGAALDALTEAVRLHREALPQRPAQASQLAAALNNLGVCLRHRAATEPALAVASEAVDLYRTMIATNAARAPTLADALANLGACYHDLGRADEAAVATEEAVRRYGDAASPAARRGLAAALNNLGMHHIARGRHDEAVAAAQQSVQCYRELLPAVRALAGDLARALNNLASAYQAAGRAVDAVPVGEEAVRLYRDATAVWPARPSELASALNNLSVHYGDVGRTGEAMAAVTEAVQIYHDLAAGHPQVLPNLASALVNLEQAAGSGATDDIEQAWTREYAGDPARMAYLVLRRATAAGPGEPGPPRWLRDATRAPGLDRALVAELHAQARRHRSGDPAGFDLVWQAGPAEPLPSWLLVDTALLDRAQAWVGAPTWAEECALLAAHPELCEPTADVVVAEAYLLAHRDHAERLSALRRAARDRGAQVAYRPLLRRQLVAELVDADPPTQRTLLATRSDDLGAEETRTALSELSTADPASPDGRAARRALALLDLARCGAHEPVLDALDSPDPPPRLCALMMRYAAAADQTRLGLVAAVALSVAGTAADNASALFYGALALALDGHHDEAAEQVRRGYPLDPGQIWLWLEACAAAAQHSTGALALLVVLTEQPREHVIAAPPG